MVTLFGPERARDKTWRACRHVLWMRTWTEYGTVDQIYIYKMECITVSQVCACDVGLHSQCLHTTSVYSLLYSLNTHFNMQALFAQRHILLIHSTYKHTNACKRFHNNTSTHTHNRSEISSYDGIFEPYIHSVHIIPLLQFSDCAKCTCSTFQALNP